MLVIELAFPAGRYHATAWGRHVNEGVPEWPPSPYRLVRALFDTWKRKADAWPAERVEPLLRLLSASAPGYRLPATSVSHTRSFLSKNEEDPQARTLIFDAFVVLAPRSTALMGWPSADPTAQSLDDLDTLLSLLNYLGRSESWIEARILRGVSGVEWNCVPASATLADSPQEIIQVASPIPASEYVPAQIGTGKKAQTLSWLEAIATGTDTIHKHGLSHPPAMRYVEYSRDSRCFEPSSGAMPQAQNEAIHSVLYALDSKVLPSTALALEIAEQVRTRLMGIHKYIAGFENVSCRFSGRASSVAPLTGHRHAFYLPMDSDGDGKLDHLLIRCKEPFDASELQAMDRLDDLWQRKGKPGIRCVPIRWGGEPERHMLVRSATPFVPVRHMKARREDFPDWLRGEVARECRNHGLPEPVAVTGMPELEVAGGRTVRWSEFRRNRKEDPVRSGYGLVLEFAVPVTTPFSLGYGCHFGLGQFQPME